MPYKTTIFTDDFKNKKPKDSNHQSKGKKLAQKHSATLIYQYLDKPEQISLQQLNRRFYKTIMP
jgi:hypothetical protein